MERRRPASWVTRARAPGSAMGAVPGTFSSNEKRARHRARVLSTRRGAGRASQAQCRTRHAPKSARGPRGRNVGWGWPHLQSRAGSRRAHLLESRSRDRPRPGVERDICVGETEGGASPTLRASRDACPHNPSHQGLGWRRRQVMARTSSKRSRILAARRLSTKFVRARRRMWLSTSLAEANAIRQWWMRSRPVLPCPSERFAGTDAADRIT